MAANNASTGDDIYRYFVLQSNAMALAAGKSPMRWEEVWKHFGTQLDSRTIIHAWLSSAALFDAANHGYRGVFSVNDEAYYLGAQAREPAAAPRCATLHRAASPYPSPTSSSPRRLSRRAGEGAQRGLP
jgi:hypothetical protein